MFERLRAANPHPTTELEYASAFELLIAVILSAQATDRGVNIATRKLFPVANTPQALLALGEDATKAGLTADDLAKLDAIVAMDILPNATTTAAHVVLPSSAPFEKRGSMINLKGRLQRLNKVVPAPGDAHDDWEILRDLILAISGSNGLHSIEEVFKAMSAEVQEFAAITLSRIGDLGLDIAAQPQNTP